MSSLRQIRWGWVLVGGLVAELVLMLAVPIQFLPGGQTLLLYLVVPLCLLVTALAGYWIAAKVGTAPVLHGGLVGAVALVLYAALTWTQALPIVYAVANLSKIVGGMAGGWFASRRRAVGTPEVGRDPAAPG